MTPGFMQNGKSDLSNSSSRMVAEPGTSKEKGSLYPIFPLTSPKGSRIVACIFLHFLKPEVPTVLIIGKSIVLIPIQDAREI